MLSKIPLLLALLELAYGAPAPTGPKVLNLQLSKVQREAHACDIVGIRQDAPSDSLVEDRATYYGVDLSIGTPAQSVSFLLDTSSSGLVVGPDFNISNSTTYQRADSTDSLAIGGTTLTDINLSLTTKEGTNVFGLGYPISNYPSIPAQLKKQGLLESESYSIWLNSNASASGSIMFGGVDHALYEGTLAKVPIVVRKDETPRLAITLNSISVGRNGQSAKVVDEASLAVLLDTTAASSLIPYDWVAAIASTVGAWFDTESFNWILLDKPTGTIDLEFSGVTISTPLDNFFRPTRNANGTPYQKDGKDVYEIGAYYIPLKDGVDQTRVYALGESLLAGAYLAFDLENNVVGLGQAKTVESIGSNIEAIGASGIPGTAAPQFKEATSTHTNYVLHTPSGLFV